MAESTRAIQPAGEGLAGVGHAGGGIGFTLISALESYIVPLIQGNRSELGINFGVGPTAKGETVGARSRLGLTTEARDLLDALEKYIFSVVKAPSSHRGIKPSEEIEKAVVDANPRLDERENQNTIVRNPRIPVNAELFNKVMEKAHMTVFNKMPIRMLMFNGDGTGIKLGDRNEVWRYVSAQIQREFHEPTFRHRDLNYAWLAMQHMNYAILSHTWLQGPHGEVTYGDWNLQTFDRASAGYAKLENFCRVAAADHGLYLGWMDTICINKESSSELDESIRSMYKWYKSAAICITYLADTDALGDMHADKWFTRGWTLQELIAPNILRFYAADWVPISPENSVLPVGIRQDDKSSQDVLDQIYQATTMTHTELKFPQLAPISRRMQWAVHRRVTREEDAVYSLMGIFDISMSIAYGEGTERAFGRFVRGIFNKGGDGVLDISNWGRNATNDWGYGGMDITYRGESESHGSVLIPPGLSAYEWRAEAPVRWHRSSAPVLLTHVGIHLPVLMMPGVPALLDRAKFQSSYSSNDNAREFVPYGSYSAAVNLVLLGEQRVPRSSTFNILDRDIFIQPSPTPPIFRFIFGVLNFQESATEIVLPEGPRNNCFAVLLGGTLDQMRQPGFKPYHIMTGRPITFHLEYHGDASSDIRKGDLGQHGMSLHTMYL